ELKTLINNAASAFYQTTGSLTFAMRKLAENINNALLERNLSTTGRGQYALGYLALAVVRAEQCTLLLSGPVHAVWVSEGKSRHIYDPALSGKGLGSSQSIQSYLSQVEFHPQDLLALCGKFPKDWEADLLNERPPASLEASYRKLTMTQGDLNAALIQAHSGHGVITTLRPAVGAARQTQPMVAPVVPAPVVIEEPATTEVANLPVGMEPDTISTNAPAAASSITDEELDALADYGAHMVQPSAYSIPPQPDNLPPLPHQATDFSKSASPGFPTSIPRARSGEPVSTPLIPSTPEAEPEDEDEEIQEPLVVASKARTRRARSNAHAEATRQMAKVMVSGIKTTRRVNERLGTVVGRMIPRLLPGADSHSAFAIPTYVLIFIAVVIPVLVVTIASVVYLRFGQSVQYDELYGQALNQRALATSETDAVRQRDAWQSVLTTLDKADAYRKTNESEALRADAQANLDSLMGVLRLEFIPAFANGLGSGTQISRLAASESELYMLDAANGNILHGSFTGRSLSLDSSFNCKPGTYAGYQVGPLVDVLALPKVNAVGATVLGIDASGKLLYCAPGQVPHAVPLPDLPNTNWGRITAFALDNGNLYVLDAPSRAVWVFVGKDSSFLDTPYFYFGNQIPDIDSTIDMAVSGDDLYLLHADGHLTTCTFSRIAETPTRCQDPAPHIDNFPAHRDLDVFAQAHFTQLALTSPPNPVVLLLDPDQQRVYRLTPRSLELQNEVTGYSGKNNPFPPGPVRAMSVSPNYVLYLAIGNQVYFATNLP
ncbi:MAG TPA: hypothetical protein VK909_16045, partial [Anaerolineales bacterium]|nr:hypothetical protein [Anaerolineales bacterium]